MIDTLSSSLKYSRRKDLLILPLLSVLTLLCLLTGSEILARIFFTDQQIDGCMIPDQTIGFKYRPGCVTRVKAFEGPWVVNRYNECGYRTTEGCGPKSPHTLRIALIGSSVAEGWLVDYDETFSTRVAQELTRRCNRPVEVQNLGREKCGVGCTFHRLDEALALKPNLLILALSPSDVEHVSPLDFDARYLPVPVGHPEGESQGKQNALRRLKHALSSSRTVLAIEHLLFQDPAIYTKVALLEGDSTHYLSDRSSPAWEERYRAMDLFLGAMAQEASEAHVPFAFIETPSAAQIATLSLITPPAGIDPHAFNERLAQISSRHGIHFIDVLDTFRQTPGSNKFFYLTDGHINGKGEVLLSTPLANQLTTGVSPLISGCSTSVLPNSSRSF